MTDDEIPGTWIAAAKELAGHVENGSLLLLQTDTDTHVITFVAFVARKPIGQG